MEMGKSFVSGQTLPLWNGHGGQPVLELGNYHTFNNRTPYDMIFADILISPGEQGTFFIPNIFPEKMPVELRGYDGDPPSFRTKTALPTKNEAIQGVVEYCEDNPGEKFAVYETRGGIRCIMKNRQIPVETGDAFDVAMALNSDPGYIDLVMGNKGAYVARVKPKFNKLNENFFRENGLGKLRGAGFIDFDRAARTFGSFSNPITINSEGMDFRNNALPIAKSYWSMAYDGYKELSNWYDTQSNYAVCRKILMAGNGNDDPGCQQIERLHDYKTKATTSGLLI